MRRSTTILLLFSAALMSSVLFPAEAALFSGTYSDSSLSLTNLDNGASVPVSYQASFLYNSTTSSLFLTSLNIGACNVLSTPDPLSLGSVYNTTSGCTIGSVVGTLTPSFTIYQVPGLVGSPTVGFYDDAGAFNQGSTYYLYSVPQTTLSLNAEPINVPAPPSWLMMLTGLALLVPLYRRHRATPNASPYA